MSNDTNQSIEQGYNENPTVGSIDKATTQNMQKKKYSFQYFHLNP